MSVAAVTLSASLTGAAEPGLRRLLEHRVASRLSATDATLWGPDAEPEAATRLGWVDPFPAAEAVISAAQQLADTMRGRGLDRVLLCGMGGSSLGPEVIARWAGVPLTLLDTTHPASVRHALGAELRRTIVVVSSKSGSTVETTSQLAAAESALRHLGIDPADHCVIVTDPGSPLEQLARERGYACVLADPHVGGRFSALTAFGLVPTVLAGADGAELLREARAVAPALREDSPNNPALRVAAALAAALPERYIARVDEPSSLAWGLGDWIEQLVAESTGKAGLGVLPIAQGAFPSPAASGHLIRVTVGPSASAQPSSDLSVAAPLGAQFLLWETATAALGYLMGINPFDQPDVEAAKIAARTALASGPATGSVDDARTPSETVTALRSALGPQGYLSVQAYVDTTAPMRERLHTLCDRLAAGLDVPVALGFGPRYLHSTGQFHKGGPAVGTYLQVVDRSQVDLDIPGGEAGFAALISAQARGDREVLRSRGRTVEVVDVADVEALIAELSGKA